MTAAPRQEINRVYLAPHKQVVQWTVDDLMQFVSDCVRSGISGTATLVRHRDDYAFACDSPGLFYAERITPLESTQGPQDPPVPKG